jgi:hypothetical protein
MSPVGWSRTPSGWAHTAAGTTPASAQIAATRATHLAILMDFPSERQQYSVSRTMNGGNFGDSYCSSVASATDARLKGSRSLFGS